MPSIKLSQAKQTMLSAPPGHHAEPNQAMGFCLFNNIAIAAEYTRNKYHINRVAIIELEWN
jgi:acetoin utilization deacetylase AcuC-like enzyme